VAFWASTPLRRWWHTCGRCMPICGLAGLAASGQGKGMKGWPCRLAPGGGHGQTDGEGPSRLRQAVLQGKISNRHELAGTGHEKSSGERFSSAPEPMRAENKRDSRQPPWRMVGLLPSARSARPPQDRGQTSRRGTDCRPDQRPAAHRHADSRRLHPGRHRAAPAAVSRLSRKRLEPTPRVLKVGEAVEAKTDLGTAPGSTWRASR
jgi:hypothetical protein